MFKSCGHTRGQILVVYQFLRKEPAALGKAGMSGDFAIGRPICDDDDMTRNMQVDVSISLRFSWALPDPEVNTSVLLVV
jgi:hypothetical protein